jgi:hypothetical protein
MKIGMIFECGPQGADKQVCEYLGSQIRDDIEFSSITLDNKAILLRDASHAAKQLLADGCCCVLIIWDLRPAWSDKTRKPCRREECEVILASLRAAGIDVEQPVHLICVEQELESWLLADEQAIAACLSTAAHPYRVPRAKNPDAVMQPKAALITHFKNARGWRYDDKVDAIRILRAAPVNFSRLRRSSSFERFEEKVSNS